MGRGLSAGFEGMEGLPPMDSQFSPVSGCQSPIAWDEPARDEPMATQASPVTLTRGEPMETQGSPQRSLSQDLLGANN